MQLLKITLVDMDNGAQRRWAFAGEYDAVATEIEAMTLAAADPAEVLYALAIRSEAWGTLYVDSREPNGHRVADLKRAFRWRDSTAARAWWEGHKGDDTRLVEVVRVDTGERVEADSPLDLAATAATG